MLNTYKKFNIKKNTYKKFNIKKFIKIKIILLYYYKNIYKIMYIILYEFLKYKKKIRKNNFYLLYMYK